jgi:hypothetical protein
MKKSKTRILSCLSAMAFMIAGTTAAGAQSTLPHSDPGTTGIKKGPQQVYHETGNAKTPFTVAIAKPDPKLVSGRKSASINRNNPNGNRKCTPKKGHDPWSISRKDFAKLPAKTQEFLKQHPEKYTITN